MFKRAFNLILILPILIMAGAAGAAAVSKPEQPPAPPDLWYEFKTISPADNAIVNWHRAAEVEVALTSDQRQTLPFCWTPGAEVPSGEKLDGLKAWLERNDEALRLFNDSLKKSQAQWLEHGQNAQPEMNAFANLIRVRLYEAELLSEQGKYAEAGQILDGNLKLAQMAMNGGAEVIHYLLASSARTLTQNAILRLAAKSKAPVALLKGLLINLPAIDGETNLYARVLNAEFTREYQDRLDVIRLAGDCAKISATNLDLIFPEECVRPFHVLLDPSLVALHPKPFDPYAETEKLVRHYRIFKTNVIVPWADRNDQVQTENDQDRTNLLNEIAPLMELVKNEPLPLSQAAAKRARTAYIRIQNPIGRIFDCSVLSLSGSDIKVFRNRTEREAARAVLGLLIFQREKGVLPAQLSDLVDAGILDSVPKDIFADGPLHYSRERGIVWSVSLDGVDDNGKENPESHWLSDAVWHMPKTN